MAGKGRLLLILSCFVLAATTVNGEVQAPFYLPLGCYQSGPDDLMGEEWVPTDTLTKDLCAEHCQDLGYPYAGLQRGTVCLCGDQYGNHGFSMQCNFTCPIANSDQVDQCGGLDANSVVYTVDSDPATRIARIPMAHDNEVTFIEARHSCVQQNGDLIVFAAVNPYVTIAVDDITQAGHADGMYWIGLSHTVISGTFTWVNPTSQGMSASDIQSQITTGSGDCIVLDTATNAFHAVSCTSQHKYICRQTENLVDPTADPNGDGASDGEDSGDTTSTNNQLVFYLVLPLFLILYGGSCIVYIIGKSYRYCRRKQKLTRLKENLAEYDNDGRPLTSRDINMESGSPPPPYYRANSRGRKLEESKQPLVMGGYREEDERRNSRFPSRSKHYKHEDDEPPSSDNSIDFSKLSIQDIIYIKSLMGERRPTKKKRQIYVA